jgi:AcrR family transcriptional regulator
MVREKPSRRSAAQTREHILATASELFYWQGIRSTSIDKLAAEARVAPPTLYRLFASKDDLVAAYLRRNDEGYRGWFADATAARHGSPRSRIMALFDALTDQVQPARCRGCPYLMALAEYPDHESEVHRLAVATKAWVRQQLVELAAAYAATEPVADPELLADQLALLVEGVYGSVQALGITGPARRARQTAEALLDAATSIPRPLNATPPSRTRSRPRSNEDDGEREA